MERKCMFQADNAFVCAHDLNGTNDLLIMNGMRRRTETNRMKRMYILNKMNGIYDNYSYFGSARRYGRNGVTGVNGLYKQYKIKMCKVHKQQEGVGRNDYSVHAYN